MIVDTQKIESILKAVPEPDEKRVSSILDKALDLKGLSLEDAAVLISTEDPRILETIYRAANRVKLKVFGRRVVLFAPLYLSNYCTNGCLYCGFRSSNRGVERKALTAEELIHEARTLEEMGFKRVLLVLGEDKRWGIDYIVESVQAIYTNTAVRIVHVNAPPMDVEELRSLKKSGVGVYQVFQETYHMPTYAKMHPTGMKSDYDYRISVMDRALEAGFEDVGIGSLLGLFDIRFDTLATIAHSKHLYEKYGTHAHTLSIPRLRPALGSGLDETPYQVTDEEVKKVAAVYRLAVPSAGVVVSTRESAPLRESLLNIGASQISAASRTNPGGYGGNDSLEQFSTKDHRSLEEVMTSLALSGHLPSLCTSCYRSGRVGHSFTEQTIAGEMKKFCQANAILTLVEHLKDHLKNGSAGLLKKVINESLEEITDPVIKETLIEKIRETRKGKRDLHF